jgi:hypothetical protein
MFGGYASSSVATVACTLQARQQHGAPACDMKCLRVTGRCQVAAAHRLPVDAAQTLFKQDIYFAGRSMTHPDNLTHAVEACSLHQTIATAS